jgi:hypothetical protein
MGLRLGLRPAKVIGVDSVNGMVGITGTASKRFFGVTRTSLAASNGGARINNCALGHPALQSSYFSHIDRREFGTKRRPSTTGSGRSRAPPAASKVSNSC